MVLDFPMFLLLILVMLSLDWIHDGLHKISLVLWLIIDGYLGFRLLIVWTFKDQRRLRYLYLMAAHFSFSRLLCFLVQIFTGRMSTAWCAHLTSAQLLRGIDT